MIKIRSKTCKNGIKFKYKTGVCMEYLTFIQKKEQSLVIANFPQVEQSSQVLAKWREKHDHTPVIVLLNRTEIIPQNVLMNCCGGHLYRDELHLLPAMIEAQLTRYHDLDCQ
jgi:hypothetical protein